MHRDSIGVAAFLLLAAQGSAQTVVRNLYGAANAEMGRAIESAGDYNADGYPDLIVGYSADSTSDPDGGAVRIVSGRYLALGTGASTLATRVIDNSSQSFGWSVLNVGDLTGDGKPEFVVGQPRMDVLSATFQTYPDVGALHLLNGAGLTVIDTFAQSATTANSSSFLGWSLAYLGDWDLDGEQEIAAGAPFYDGAGTQRGRVRLFEVGASGFTASSVIDGATDTEQFGYSLAAANLGVFENVLNVRELVVGCPGYEILSTDQGRVQIYGKEIGVAQPQLITSYSGDASSRFGYWVDVSADFYGDAYPELVVGAPDADFAGTNSGRVYVFNGASLLPNSWFKAFTLTGLTAGDHFGTRARGVADVNGDGERDVLVGAPDVDGFFTGDDFGEVYAFSGETGVQLESLRGGGDEKIGYALGPAVDFDGDGVAEWVIGAPASDSGGTDSGQLLVVSTFPAAPVVYCTSKTNSLGCTPAMSSTGSPSLTSGASFDVRTTQLLNQRSGLHFYGFRPLGIAFQGGFQCATSPVTRMPVVNASGSAMPANDCTGVISYDYNARIQSGVDADLTLGQEVFVQCWARDPASASTTSLSNAVRFVVGP